MDLVQPSASGRTGAGRQYDQATLVTLPGIDHPNVNPVKVGEPLWDQVRSYLDHLLGSS